MTRPGVQQFIAVDWSGAKRVANKLWRATVQGMHLDIAPCASRDVLVEQLISECRLNPRTAIGLDFAFSFPRWFAEANSATSAFDVWQLCEQMGERWLAACESPFWGRRGRPRPPLPYHFRKTEEVSADYEGIRPKSVFQIGGAGAVGTGSIRGMPFLRVLRRAGIAVWPFDAPVPPMAIEIYPRVLTGSVNKSSADARSQYLRRQWPDISKDVRALMISCEDAFDAGVSALVMQANGADFPQLPSRVDAHAALEGSIWKPGLTRPSF